jgi:hypothetical protein
MISSPWVMIDLVVFDDPAHAKSLLDSFYKCASSNITEPELEIAGEELPIQLEGGLSFPALRGVVWMDIDCEEAIDDWVQAQEHTSAFMVVMGYVDSARSQEPAQVWARLPGYEPQMLGDLDGEQIAALIGVEPRQAVESGRFVETVVPLVLAHDDFVGFKAHVDALALGDQTQPAPAPSRSPRI